jgi:hypothetical protein
MPSQSRKPPAPEFFIAEYPLRISGEGWSLAYEPGDAVPAEQVGRFGWHELVTAPAPSTDEE